MEMKLVVPSEMSSHSFLKTRESRFQEKMPGLLDQRKGQELKSPSANRCLRMISGFVSRGLRLENTLTAQTQAHGRENTDRCWGTRMLRLIRAKEPPPQGAAVLWENPADAGLLSLLHSCCYCCDTAVVAAVTHLLLPLQWV